MKKSLKKLLELATLGDLKTFVTDYAKANRLFGEKLENFLSDIYLDAEEGADELIGRLQDAFMETKNIGDKWHYEEVIDWAKVCFEADEVLTDARRLLDMGNASAALQVCIQLIELADEEDVNTVDEMDEWDMSNLFDNCANLLVESISSKNVPIEEKDEAVDFLRKKLKCDLWNYGYLDTDELLRRAVAASQSDESRLRLLDNIIAEATEDYDLGKYVREKVTLLDKMGRQQEKRETIEQYLYLPDIRKDEINKAMEEKDYPKALALAEDGIRIANETGKADKEWLETEIDIYSHMDNKEMQIKLCRLLFVRGNGRMDMYKHLKQIVSKEEWKTFLYQMLSETRMSVFFGSSIEADIYVAEKDTERIFNFLMDEPCHTLDLFDKYAVHAGDEHAPEILTEYVSMLIKYAERNMGAKHYYRIRQAMEAMTKLKDGKTAAHQLAELFRNTYRRRSSFLAEIKEF